MLIFLNDVEKGGHTEFPMLHMEIKPQGGDAIVWSNEQEQQHDGGEGRGVVDRDMIHAGKPPVAFSIEKYAVNVWFA